ncbi:MAG: hypothetical protein ACI8RZ_002681 [Myxococcota bacterium]|jgi:hypothetical protein
MLLTALLTSLAAHAAPPLTIGFYAPYGVQPGLKLGTEVALPGGLFMAPQIAAFTRLDNHNSAMLNLDVGYRHQGKGARYSAFSVGVAYLLSAQIVTESIDLSTGEYTTTRELRHYAVPTLNYELGWSLPAVDPYLKLSIGRKISPQVEDSMFFAVEIGLRFGSTSEMNR